MMFLKLFCRWILFVLIFLMPLTGVAEETEGPENQPHQWGIILGLFTRHVDPSDNTNESTRMLGLLYSDWGVIGFKNSYHDQSFFGGRRFHTKKIGLTSNSNFFVQGNLYAGLLHGYGDRFPNIEGITPAVFPTIGFGYKNTTIDLQYVPTPSGGVFTSFLTYRF